MSLRVMNFTFVVLRTLVVVLNGALSTFWLLVSRCSLFLITYIHRFALSE